MLTYSFTDIGSDSLYIHLYKCIRNDILQGKIRPGEKLPSKRTFAKNLGISVITVENAYGQLASEGYIYSVPKKGFFAADIVPDLRQKKTAPPPDPLPAAPVGVSRLADFTSNQTEPDSFPFSVWSRIMRRQLGENQKALMTNPPSGGVAALRQAIARHLADFHGLRINPEQIIIGAGTEYLCSLLVQLLGYDKIYGVEDPSYSKIRKVYQGCNVTCRPVEMDDSGVQAEDLEAADIDVIHISPSHQYPTGIVMPVGRRYEILGWASRSDRRYIVEDDFDSELRLKGQPVPTMQSIDVMEKVIYMNTFTKTLSSTIRISYMVLPPRLVRRFYEKLSFYACTVPNFEQYTLAEFIEDGSFEKHINRMRNHYRKKRDLLLKLIRSGPLGEKCEILEENAGLHFLLRIRSGNTTDEEIIRKAGERQIRLSALSQYYSGGAGKRDLQHIFVINYSSVPEENLPAAVKILGEILNDG